jgi:hypothetical protein
MQVLACIFGEGTGMFKTHFARSTTTDEHRPRCAPHARGRRPFAMMAPVIILGAIMMLVFWDTSDHR